MNINSSNVIMYPGGGLFTYNHSEGMQTCPRSLPEDRFKGYEICTPGLPESHSTSNQLGN